MSEKKPPRKGRQISDDEERLWSLMVQDVAPLHKNITKSRRSARPPVKKDSTAIAPPQPAAPADDVKAFAPRKGHKGKQQAPKAQSRGAHQEQHDQSSKQLDGRTAQRLKRGRIALEDSIDLHGMNQAEAHAALLQFMRRSAALKYRCVLVITGKGSRKASEDAPQGILRKRLPEWLSLEPLRSLVLKCEGARQHHGGSGAFYIYLRRNREN